MAFKNVSFEIRAGEALAITGFNGSGKSTLLKIISGYTIPTEGEVKYSIDGAIIPQENIFHHLSFAAPYLDLIDDFTLTENVSFFTQFKKLRENISTKELIHLAFLEGSENKQVKFFSSGMKQRLKLSLAVFSETLILLLDEPLANLDRKGFDWYARLMQNYLEDRICIICSNNTKDETAFCKTILNVETFKP